MSILSPTPEAIQAAAKSIRDGKLVVIPTETVYGLAGNAMDEQAVQLIYDVKGRPNDNPLIVHVSQTEQAKAIVREWPEMAEKLAEKYWPGPLTLVLPKKPSVPDCVTGGKETVAIRIPKHPIALKVISEAGVPVAAPSANIFMALSPTKAQDIEPEIDLEVEFILDGGPCEVGLESTVLDLTQSSPQILRPGGISRAEIQAILGRPLGHVPPGSIRAPGMYPRHYAPKATVILVDKLESNMPGLTFEQSENNLQIEMPSDSKSYGVRLYGALRQLDLKQVDKIYVQRPPQSEQWEAVMDRLQKASTSLA